MYVLQLLLHLREQRKKITRGLAGGNTDLGDQLNVVCFRVVQSGGSGVGTCVVWSNWLQMPLFGRRTLQSLEDLVQAGVDVPLGVDWLPLPERNRSHMTGLGEEDRDVWKCFTISLTSPVGSHLGKDCCLIFESYWYIFV